MLVSEYLKFLEERYPSIEAALLVTQLLALLDYFDSEACSVVAGKIRAQLGMPEKEY